MERSSAFLSRLSRSARLRSPSSASFSWFSRWMASSFSRFSSRMVWRTLSFSPIWAVRVPFFSWNWASMVSRSARSPVMSARRLSSSLRACRDAACSASRAASSRLSRAAFSLTCSIRAFRSSCPAALPSASARRAAAEPSRAWMRARAFRVSSSVRRLRASICSSSPRSSPRWASWLSSIWAKWAPRSSSLRMLSSSSRRWAWAASSS